MKRLRISKLMDEYTDTEFFPTGGSTANVEEVRGWVLANAKVPAEKKRMPKKKALRLAVAMAAVLAILVGAGFPQTIYQLANGTVNFTENVDGKEISFVTKGDPIKLEDGRLFLVQDDGETDITDLISETKPYIIDRGDPDQDIVHYLVLGGTPEHYGSFEWLTVPCPESFEDHAYEDGRMHVFNCALVNTLPDGERYQSGASGLCDPDWEEIFSRPNGDPRYRLEEEDFQWILAAAEELEIPFADYGDQDGIIIVEDGGILEGG